MYVCHNPPNTVIGYPLFELCACSCIYSVCSYVFEQYGTVMETAAIQALLHVHVTENFLAPYITLIIHIISYFICSHHISLCNCLYIHKVHSQLQQLYVLDFITNAIPILSSPDYAFSCTGQSLHIPPLSVDLWTSKGTHRQLYLFILLLHIYAYIATCVHIYITYMCVYMYYIHVYVMDVCLYIYLYFNSVNYVVHIANYLHNSQPVANLLLQNT